MTITSIVLCVFGTLCALFVGGYIIITAVDSGAAKVLTGIIVAAIIAGFWVLGVYISNNTASGRRALIDQKSNFSNGIERVINVYTANGDKLATYKGKIDIEANDGGYVKFDFKGKRYIYYNCFVETIADIE